MTPGFSRRDFLRLTGMLPLSLAAPRWTRKLAGPGDQQNVIVVVFDAMSALNVSLYGYARETMPNLARLSKRAIVYHDHYAGSSFTTSGTASLLTGTYPWKHRAIARQGKMAALAASHSVFSLFGDYHRISYTHNPVAFVLLNQLKEDINELMPVQELLLRSYDSVLGELFSQDEDISNVGWLRHAKLMDGYAYSLYFSHLDEFMRERQQAGLAREFPGGAAPWVGGQFFLLEDAVDRIAEALAGVPQPFLGYFHCLPPHAPYRPPLGFNGRFHQDDYVAVQKPLDQFANERDTRHGYKRVNYDEYLLYVDQQFARLYDQLEQAGLLDNTWLILTSDHGEMFERGITGHMTEALYQPVVRIPLLIFEPGRQQRMDIHTLTSAVDLLPTLAHLTAHALPLWTEGSLLPPYAAAAPDPNRGVYALYAARNNPSAPLTNASTILVKGNYKLHYYFGYPVLKGSELVKLYDVRTDPEEMNDLASAQKDVTAALLKEAKAKIAEVNRPYE